MFKTPIIPIERAPESLVNALIDAGILIVTEDGLKCVEAEPGKVYVLKEAEHERKI